MATRAKKKAGGDSTSRTKVVGVRLDPKLRYLAELGARKQRRSLSSFIEWAIEESLGRIIVREESDGDTRSIAEESEWLWDVDDADRFAKLALRYPEMLTHEEQIIWKLVRENGYLWKGKYVKDKWTWSVHEDNFIFGRLREHWEDFVAVARGTKEPSCLPVWQKEKAVPEPSAPDFDDDIPF